MQLNIQKNPNIATHAPVPPKFDAQELYGVIPTDTRKPFDVREIIARIVDGSEFDEFKARYGDRVIGFENQDPTTELMARTIFDHASTALTEYAGRTDTRYRLAPGVRLVRVRVWETTSSWAEYERTY